MKATQVETTFKGLNYVLAELTSLKSLVGDHYSLSLLISEDFHRVLKKALGFTYVSPPDMLGGYLVYIVDNLRDGEDFKIVVDKKQNTSSGKVYIHTSEPLLSMEDIAASHLMNRDTQDKK